MKYTSRGFTLVEILVVVVIIAVISTISLLSYNNTQREQRNTVRASKVELLSKALEDYYNANGEYPSVASIAGQPATTVSQKLGITDLSILTLPGATTSNSLTATDAGTDKIAYNGNSDDEDQNVQCQTSTTGGCDEYSLQYYNEASDEIQTVDSLHQGRDVKAVDTLPTPTMPTISSDMVSGKIRYTVTDSTCDQGGLQYKIRYGTSPTLGAWTDINWMDVNTLDVDPGTSTLFYAQAITRCNDAVNVSLPSDESNVDKFNLLETRVKATLSGTTITTVISLASPCAAGTTTMYKLQQRVDTGTTGAWTVASDWSTTATKTFATSAGQKYNYKAQSRCDVGATAGTPSPESDIAAIVTAPAVPTVSISTSGSTTTWTWNSVSCPIGYSPRYNVQWTANGNLGNGTWSDTAALSTARTTTSQGYTYGNHVQTRCYNAAQTPTTSNWSAVSNTPTYTRPVTNSTKVLRGGVRMYQFSDGIGTSGEWKITASDVSCGPSYLVRQVHWRQAINSVSGGWSAYSNWANWTASTMTGKGSGDLDLGDYQEFSFSSRCYNTYTGAYGPSTYSDRFGNHFIARNSGPTKWQTNCIGSVPEGDNYCAINHARDAALAGHGSNDTLWSSVWQIGNTPYGW